MRRFRNYQLESEVTYRDGMGVTGYLWARRGGLQVFRTKRQRIPYSSDGRCCLVVHEMQDLLQIFPSFALGVLIARAQKVGRMVRHHHRDVAPFEPAAA